MKFWNWLTSFFFARTESSKEFDTKNYLDKLEKNRIEATMMNHRPVYTRDPNKAA